MALDSVCVVQTLRAAARLLTRKYEQALRPHGLTASQFTILQSVRVQEGLSLVQLSAQLALDQTTLSRTLTTMRRQDLVWLGKDSADKRAKTIHTTPKGAAKHADALPAWQAVQDQVLSHVASQDWLTVRHFLHHLSR